MTRRQVGTSLVAVLLLFGANISKSLAADSSKGSFHYGKVQFQPSDSLAYLVDGKDPAKPLPIVILTNFKIDRPTVMEAIDPAGAVINQAARERANVVFVRLVAPDKCGVGGFLGQTSQQIDLGESFSAKTTAMTAVRIAGECSTSKPGKMFDDSYEFRLSYDAPVTTIPKPSPIPADGGDPGKAYVALVKAIQAADWDAAHIHLGEGQAPATRPKAADMKNYFEGLALNYPKTVTVAGGLMKGSVAQIDIRGTDHDRKKIKGVVAMKKVAGQWQVLDQNLFFME